LTDEVSRQIRETRQFSFRVSRLDGHAMALYVAQIAQPLAERLKARRIRSRRKHREITDPRNFTVLRDCEAISNERGSKHEPAK
jgi:hypothetical protein